MKLCGCYDSNIGIRTTKPQPFGLENLPYHKILNIVVRITWVLYSWVKFDISMENKE